MPVEPSIQNVPAVNPTLFIISNLSFERNEDLLASYLSEDVSADRIQLIHLTDTADWRSQVLQAQGEIIPLFDCSEATIVSFFSLVLNSHASLLTLYVQRPLCDGERIPKGRVGKLMTNKKLNKFSDGKQLLTYVKGKLDFIELALHSQQTIIDADTNHIDATSIKWSEIDEELELLRHRGDLIMERKEFQLFLTNFDDLQAVPIMIGLLREQTYAAVGEGTGKGLDLDPFDQSYQQLFLVDTAAEKIVGGYRIGSCGDLLNKFGISGLYMHTLYHIEDDIVPILQQSMELGRSFIIPEYQKKQMPLFLLWNGILTFMDMHPAVRYIFGMVSISRAYSDISRNLITAYLRQHHFDHSFAAFVKPRQEYIPSAKMESMDNIIKVFNGELIRLDEFISEIEPQKYRLPVLIRKYINQNARFIGFNIDPDFSNCVDGLMVFDNRDIPLKTVQMLRKN